jgi:ACS family hexuronate transporter-like MFS transporter
MISEEIAAQSPPDTVGPDRDRSYRWVICFLLFLVATVNYIARQVIGLLKPTLQVQIGWNEIGYSNIIFAFQFAYAIGLLLFGKLMDRLGTRKGFSFSVALWSLAAMAHALVHSVLGFGVARFALGLGESGNFPASIKAVSEWFPKKERALATGIFNAGTNVGPVITPFIVAWTTGRYGWRVAFVVTGATGLVWLVLWLLMYRRPAREFQDISVATQNSISGDPAATSVKIPWVKLIRLRQTWAFAIGKFMTDPIWWLFLFWLPDFLYKRHGITLLNVGPPLFVIYGMATVGSVGGGWLSSFLLKRGWSANASRKTTMLICALAVVPIVFASMVSSLWLAVGLIALAVSAHQGWSANMFTIATDMFPSTAIGSVVGLGGMLGAVGGLLFAKITGYILQWTGRYILIFVIAGSAYLVALTIIQILVPRLEPATFYDASL